MNTEEALLVLDTALEQKILNNVQELVFRQSWLGQTYLEMAETSGYNANYIKDVGYKLWKLLSKVFEEEVTKSNLHSVLRRKHINFKKAMQASKQDLLMHSAVEEAESANYKDIDASVSPRNSLDPVSEPIETQQLFVNTVISAPLNIQKIQQNKTIRNDVLTVIPQLVDPKEPTTKIHQSLKQAVDLLSFDECGTEIDLLKQSIGDNRYCLVAVLAQGRDEVTSY